MAAGVSWMLELSVQPGREKDLTLLANEMVAATRANEAGTLDYEWSLSSDGSVCHIFERYADSAAVMVHLGTFDKKFAARFLEILKPARFVVYGSPSPEVKDALDGMNAVYLQPLGGFSR
jgi:quinol monooxygenase YgiN